ncbi:MAG: hypothetical protein ACC652_01125 [Acidimicrobiales bacterium]
MITAFTSSTSSDLRIYFLLGASLLIIAWGVWDAMHYPQSRWESIDRSRRAWVIMQIVFGPPAVFLYAAAVRFDLKDPDRVAYVGDNRS